MTLLRSLLNAGVLANDAQVLEAAFANEPEQDFLAGLEQIARTLASGNVTLMPPIGEPWYSIHAVMLQSGLAPDAALAQALGAWPPDVQAAIAGAVSLRMQDIQIWAQQQQSQGRKRKTKDYINALAHLGYSFRYNLCTHHIEINGKPIDDLKAAEIRNRMRDFGFWELNVTEDAYSEAASNNRYHPIRDYLASLRFDGGDPIGELAGYCSDEHGVFATWLRRWLIGSCARVMAGEQNRMLVMDGYQGMGKDHFVRWLSSPNPEYYNEGPIMPDDKDHRLKLLSCWIWNVNELGSTTRRSDREALKAFLSIQTVRERKAYGRYDVQGVALSSFAGTVNNEGGILNDPTGHRRFMVVHLKTMDWNYTKLDVDQIWAQAYELYLSGEPWNLQGDELATANQINEQYQVTDIVEETIKEIFIVDPADTQSWMSTYEILELLKAESNFVAGIRGGNLKPGSEIDTRRLASALTKLGLTKTDPQMDQTGRRRRGYFGIRRRP